MLRNWRLVNRRVFESSVRFEVAFLEISPDKSVQLYTEIEVKEMSFMLTIFVSIVLAPRQSMHCAELKS